VVKGVGLLFGAGLLLAGLSQTTRGSVTVAQIQQSPITGRSEVIPVTFTPTTPFDIATTGDLAVNEVGVSWKIGDRVKTARGLATIVGITGSGENFIIAFDDGGSDSFRPSVLVRA